MSVSAEIAFAEIPSKLSKAASKPACSNRCGECEYGQSLGNCLIDLSKTYSDSSLAQAEVRQKGGST